MKKERKINQQSLHAAEQYRHFLKIIIIGGRVIITLAVLFHCFDHRIGVLAFSDLSHQPGQ